MEGFDELDDRIRERDSELLVKIANGMLFLIYEQYPSNRIEAERTLAINNRDKVIQDLRKALKCNGVDLW